MSGRARETGTSWRQAYEAWNHSNELALHTDPCSQTDGGGGGGTTPLKLPAPGIFVADSIFKVSTSGYAWSGWDYKIGQLTTTSYPDIQHMLVKFEWFDGGSGYVQAKLSDGRTDAIYTFAPDGRATLTKAVLTTKYGPQNQRDLRITAQNIAKVGATMANSDPAYHLMIGGQV